MDLSARKPGDVTHGEDPTTRFMRLFSAAYTLLHRQRSAGTLSVTPEGRALLLHLAWTGPMTISELTRHAERAQSVVSESVAVLESHGLLDRVRDPRDHRRTLVWLTERARSWLAEEQEPLERTRLEAVFATFPPETREPFLDAFDRFIAVADAQARTFTEPRASSKDEVATEKNQKEKETKP